MLTKLCGVAKSARKYPKRSSTRKDKVVASKPITLGGDALPTEARAKTSLFAEHSLSDASLPLIHERVTPRALYCALMFVPETTSSKLIVAANPGAENVKTVRSAMTKE